MRYLLFTLIFSVTVLKVYSQFRFTNVICNSTHPMTYYEKCFIKQVNKTMTALTVQHILLETIHSAYGNISIIQLSRRLNRVLYTFRNVDVCAFMVKRRNPVLRLLFSFIQKYSNANHSCPFKNTFLIHQLTVDEIHMPAIIRGEYLLQTAWKLNGINAARVDVSLSYVSSQARFTKLVCNSTHPMFYYEKCFIKPVNKTTTAVTVQLRLLETIHSAYGNITLILLSGRLNRVLYKFRNVDACAFLVKRRNPVLRLLFSLFEKFSNANHSCPYKDIFVVNQLTIGQIHIAGLPVMRGEYQLQTAWKFNGISAATVDVSLSYV
ncbi:unnamed protein product [Ceratitis capitata]|uniref:(Mediterranean fruit fly) hypothetical protein n=1 Tax=Ceratitis capitata TaxID=7213 RepID=A0A811VDV1_CERCA|nr:unnamed protein product [Ceratitis capitata]